MMRRNDQGLGGAGLNPELLARINAASAVLNQRNSGNKPADKNAILKQLLENSGKKSSSKISAADSPTSTTGYLLLLLSSVFLLTGWLGSWTNGGGGQTTTPHMPTTTTTPEMPTNRLWKYNCPFGYQGRQCDECGVQKVMPNIKIVGGIDAVPHSWPFQILLARSYQASLFNPKDNKTYTYTQTNQFYCGGSLITRDTVLTAAHCFDEPFQTFNIILNGKEFFYTVVPTPEYPTLESRYSVYLGVNNKTIKDQDPNVIRVPVAYLALHPEYNLDGVRKLNDIAIIKLAWEVELNDNIQLACLPDPNEPNYPTQTGVDAFVMGWGALDEKTQEQPDVLQNIILDLFDPKECTYYGEGETDWDTQICAGYMAGGKDTCQGDSGGPLYVKDYVPDKSGVLKQKFVQAGVVSYGPGCARPNTQGIYTKVSAYNEWISKYL